MPTEDISQPHRCSISNRPLTAKDGWSDLALIMPGFLKHERVKFFFSFEIWNISAELEEVISAVDGVYTPLIGGNSFEQVIPV
jgi:hypothetical protein